MRTTTLSLLMLVVGCGREALPPPITPNEVIAKKVPGDLPRTDPASALWDSAPEHVAKLLLQDQTEPRLVQPSVEVLRIRALTDGQWIAFRIEWDDATRDALAGVRQFTDAVAVQVPFEAGGEVPDGAMGQAGRPVRIHVWKASAQEALARKVDAVTALYPNASSDHYPYEAAPTERDRAILERLYAPAKAAGNPWSNGRSDAPVQDLVAAGFGSLSPAPEPVSLGSGAHDGGRWHVVIARPLDPDAGQALRSGTRTYAAFAVWDGSAGNVGARKMRTGWIPLVIE